MNGLAPVNMPEGAFLGTGALLLSSLLWIACIALLAAALAWPLGIQVARRCAQGRGMVAACVLTLPVCVPAYLAFWSLWHLLEPTSWLGDRLLRMGAAVGMRETVLVVALTLWSVPMAAWCVVAGRVARPDPTERLRVMDGAGWRAHLAAAWRRDGASLVLGVAVASLGLLGESVSFDLAQVRTYGFELRSLDLSGAGPGAVVSAAWPSILLAAGLIAAVLLMAKRWSMVPGDAGAQEEIGRRGRAGWVLMWSLLCLVALPPCALLAYRWSWHDVDQFLALHARPATTSVILAATVGVLLAALAVALRGSRELAPRPARHALAAVSVLFILVAALPATVVAIGHEALWNNEYTGRLVYDTPAVVVIALVSRLGVVSVLSSALVARRPSADRLLEMDGTGGWSTGWRTWRKVRRPELIAVATAAGVVGAALAFSEIAVTSRIVPPRMQLLATSTLNAIHYQQPETVLMAASGAIALGVIGAVVLVVAVGRNERGRGRGDRDRGPLKRLVLLPLLALVSGCGPSAGSSGSSGGGPDPYDGVPPIPCVTTFGTSGFGPGQFRTPRAVAYDPTSDSFYVVDKEARIQRFAGDGRPERSWRMPDSSVGKPVGLSVHPDGRLFVADTHYNRVLLFDREGRELGRFGSYGQEPGQFIYPTDIAFGTDGRIYVGEYGGNDRIQIFSPSLQVQGVIGSAGIEDGQLSRPQGLAFDAEHNELYVADSNNHRVVVYDPDGRRLRQFGSAGTEVGKLSYPRGIVFCGDGSIMVVEFGNHRVQRFVSAAGSDFGKSLGVWGGMSLARPGAKAIRGVSEGEAGSIAESFRREADQEFDRALDGGRLQYPWDMAGRPGHVMILDSGHDRVMIARLPT